MGAILNEIGRVVQGPSIDHRISEEGRRMIRRPLDEKGRWLLGDYAYLYSDNMATSLHIDFTPIVESEFTSCSSCWDLLKLMPQKFHDAPMMAGYLNAISNVVNSINCRIETLGPLVDIDTCPKRYLGHLASLIAYQLKNQKYATTAELRNQIRMAVEMYKINGTYDVLKLAFYILGLNVSIYDLWTRDYINFQRQPPHKHSGLLPIYGGWETESGLHCDDGYYMDETTPQGGGGVPSPWHFDGGLGFKSPHFDIVIELDKLIYFQGYYNTLFVSDFWTSMAEIFEEFTPVNTVPHVYLGLYAKCFEDYLAYTILDSQVKTCLMNVWDVSKLYLDAAHHADEVPIKAFDQSFEAMLKVLTVFKVGDGNVGHTPVNTDTNLAHITYTGTVTSYTLTQDKVTFRMTIPTGVALTGITELGIFNSGTGALTIEANLPALDKPTDVDLEITIDVVRKQT